MADRICLKKILAGLKHLSDEVAVCDKREVDTNLRLERVKANLEFISSHLEL